MSFEHWFQQAGRAKVEVEPRDSRKPAMDSNSWEYELMEANGWPAEGEPLYYPCHKCEEDTLVECDLNEFDGEEHYCGRSPHCCP